MNESTNAYSDYRRRRDAIEAARPQPCKPGDRVKLWGLLFEIKQIHYQDAYLEYSDEFPDGRWFWDVEFLDTSESYHHWKSYFDGGELLYAKV